MEIRHQAFKKRFVAREKGRLIGYLEYRPAGNGVVDYWHTFVLEGDRGRGVATALVSFALNYAHDNGLRVVPSCPFVATHMETDPRFRRLRAAADELGAQRGETRRLLYAMEAARA